MRTAIMGGTGYAGAELLRLAAGHADLDVVLVTGESRVGEPLARAVPSLAALYGDLVVQGADAALAGEFDVVFLALPHGASQRYVPALLERASVVVDLGADFRLRDAAAYPRWYHDEHCAPDLLAKAVYGLVERHRGELVGATLIAAPGCYPTASALALGPFLDAGVMRRDHVIVNALSGVSGAGRASSERLGFARLASNAEAYGLLEHRHTPEIEQEIGASVLFTPHLIPVSRGLLVSAYGPLDAGPFTTEDALALLRSTYASDPFVVVSDDPPTLKDPVGSNLCFVSARVDERNGWILAMASIDNLGKGAAGQAIQAFNVATGRPEVTGLALAGVTP